MKIAFISGHINITEDEFKTNYHEQIDKAIKEKHKFVIGNSDGADFLALQYLLKNNVNSKDITIYYYTRYPNNKTRSQDYYKNLNLNVLNGFKSYTHRDENMTLISDYDIAWVRPLQDTEKLYGNIFEPNRKSGTQLNLERRINIK